MSNPHFHADLDQEEAHIQRLIAEQEEKEEVEIELFIEGFEVQNDNV